jgi:hypothetical protein
MNKYSYRFSVVTGEWIVLPENSTWATPEQAQRRIEFLKSVYES